MKKILSAISTFFIFFTVIFFHDAKANDPKEDLEKTKKYIEEHYPGYINNLHRSQIFNYLSWRSQDFLITNYELSNQVKVAWEIFLEKSKTWTDMYARAVSSNPDQLELLAVDLADLMATMESQARLLQMISADFKVLSKVWKDRCSDSRLAYSYDFFDPQVLYAPSRIDLKAVGYPLTVGFQVSSDYSGGISSAPFLVKDEDKIIFAAGLSAAPFTFGLSVVAAAVVVSVKSVITANSHYNEEKKIIQEIVDVQQKSINSLHDSSHKIIQDACNELMPDLVENVSVTDAIAYTTATIESKASAATDIAVNYRRLFLKLEELLKSHLSTVIKANSSKIRIEFLANIKAADAELEASDLNIEGALPQLSMLIGKRRKSTSPVQKAALDQALWSLLIKSEVQYAPPETKFTTFTLWEQTRDFVRAEVAK